MRNLKPLKKRKTSKKLYMYIHVLSNDKFSQDTSYRRTIYVPLIKVKMNIKKFL